MAATCAMVVAQRAASSDVAAAVAEEAMALGSGGGGRNGGVGRRRSTGLGLGRRPRAGWRARRARPTSARATTRATTMRTAAMLVTAAAAVATAVEAAAATRRLQQRAAAATVMEWVAAAAVATRHGARAAYPEGQWPSAGGRNGSRITMCRAHSHAVPHARTRDQHQLQQRSLRWMRNPLQNDELEIGLCEPRLQFLQAKAMQARPCTAVWQSASQMLTSIHSNGPSLQPSSPTSPFAQNHHTQLLKEVNTFHDNNGRRQ